MSDDDRPSASPGPDPSPHADTDPARLPAGSEAHASHAGDLLPADRADAAPDARPDGGTAQPAPLGAAAATATAEPGEPVHHGSEPVHGGGEPVHGGGEPVGDAAAAPRRRRSTGSFLRELPVLIVIAFVLALVIKAFLVQAFYIPSGSMEQTLAIRDRVLVNKLVYDFRGVHRGEIIVFNGKDSFSPDEDTLVFAEPTNPVQKVLRKVAGYVGLGAPGEKDFIKRVIGLPGDRVACCSDGKVTVQPAGGRPVPLDEPYLYENDPPIVFCQAGMDEASCPTGAPGVLVPPGRLFVMGDHRNGSSDSRLHLDDGQSGTVPESEVIGRAFVVVWPFAHATVLHVPGVFGQKTLSLGAGAVAATPYALGAVGVLPVGLLRARRRRRRAATS